MKSVEEQEVYDDGLSKEEIKLLEDRWTDYVKNPKKVEPWDKVKSELTKKYVR